MWRSQAGEVKSRLLEVYLANVLLLCGSIQYKWMFKPAELNVIGDGWQSPPVLWPV